MVISMSGFFQIQEWVIAMTHNYDDKVKLYSCGGHWSPASGSTEAKSNLASADFGHKVANKGTHNFISS